MDKGGLMMSSENVGFLKAFPILFRSRLEAIFIWSWLTAIICLVLGRGSPPLWPSLFTILSMILLSMSTYVYNDITDMKMDAHNEIKGKRPLPSKRVSVSDAKIVAVVTGALGLATSFLVSTYGFIFASLYTLVLIGYSHPLTRFKKRFLLNELFYFTCFPWVGLMVCYALEGRVVMPAMFAAIIFGSFITPMKPLFGDSTDMYEDKLFGMRHLGVVLSWKGKIQLMIVTLLFIMTITPLTYVQLGFNVVVPIMVVAMSLGFLRMMFPIMNAYDTAMVMRAKKFAHIYFFALQIVLIVGTLNLGFL
jgi:4-hydroxybenzoate polyprenyltransferase